MRQYMTLPWWSWLLMGLGLALSVLYRHTAYYAVMAIGEKIENACNKALISVKKKWNERKARKMASQGSSEGESLSDAGSDEPGTKEG